MELNLAETVSWMPKVAPLHIAALHQPGLLLAQRLPFVPTQKFELCQAETVGCLPEVAPRHLAALHQPSSTVLPGKSTAVKKKNPQIFICIFCHSDRSSAAVA
jgi:hypothetical protein